MVGQVAYVTAVNFTDKAFDPHIMRQSSAGVVCTPFRRSCRL